MRRPGRALKTLAAAVVLALPVTVAARPAPALRIVAPPELERAAREVSELSKRDFSHLLILTGVMGFRRPVTVVLVPESSPVAADTPPWISGYARGDRATIVLFPDRVPSYPDRNLESLFRHELAHLLVWEAGGGRAPRWLDEGIATIAAREWGLEDRARFSIATFGRGPRSVSEVDRAFSGSASEASTAYALSSGFVRFLQAEYGEAAPADILQGLAGGRSLDDAFASATGVTLARAQKRFFRSESLWNLWVPILTSPTSLWMVVTLLALVAVAKRLVDRRRLAAEEEATYTIGDDEEVM